MPATNNPNRNGENNKLLI